MEEGHHGVKIVVELPKPAGNLFEWSISQRRPLCDLQALDLVDLFDEPTPIREVMTWRCFKRARTRRRQDTLLKRS